MSELATIHAPMRIMGIQARAELADVHDTLAQLWTRWQND